MRRSSSLLLLLLVAACGRHTQGDTTDPPNGGTESGGGGIDSASGGADAAMAGYAAASGSMGPSSSGGAAGAAQSGGAAGAVAMGGAPSAGQSSLGGAPDQEPEGGSSGGGGQPPSEGYLPRSGSFKMVVYSKTALYRHVGSIESGTRMLQQIANEVGATALVTEENSFIDDLADYELLFLLNPSGGVFSTEEKAKLEAWMISGGALCGTHSAAETEYGWPFYLRVIGQNDEGHSSAGTTDSLVLTSTALSHPALRGLPNPWSRVDEWLRFESEDTWSHEPGFTILARKGSDGLPISWVREYGGFRSFYTGIGHDAAVFEDPLVKQHVKGGILWAVRREHCLTTPRPAGCL